MTAQPSIPNNRQRSPTLAFILGLLPGVGQVYAGQIWRGLGVFFFAVTTISLIWWRLMVHGVNYTGPALQGPDPGEVPAALGMGFVIAVIFVLIYLWSI